MPLTSWGSTLEECRRLWSRNAAARRRTSRRSVKAKAEILETRTMLSSVSFEVVTGQSNTWFRVQASVNVAGTDYVLSTQGTGSDTTTVLSTGTIDVILDSFSRPSSIQIVDANLPLDNSGSWSPDVNGATGSSAANFGHEVTGMSFQAYGFPATGTLDSAIRDIVASAATDGAVAVTDGNFSAGGVAWDIDTGNLDFLMETTVFGTVYPTPRRYDISVANLSPDGTQGAASITETTTPGTYELRIPISQTLTAQLPDLPVAVSITRTVTGVVVARYTPSYSTDTAGLYVPGSSLFFLNNSNSTKNADLAFGYGPGGLGWEPLVGDWDGDGTDTVGLYVPGSSTFLLNNSNSTKNADVVFSYGPGGLGWEPIVGDWDGDGTDTVGLYVPGSSLFFLNNSNSTKNADVVFGYGAGGLGWEPLVGDWDGNDTDTVGLYVPGSSTFLLNNSNSMKNADLIFGYGPGGLGWEPIVGDWDADGTDTIGLYVPGSSTFLLNNSNSTKNADIIFGYGPGGLGWEPIVGDWDGGSALMAAASEVPSAADAVDLTQAELEPLVTEAVSGWTELGLPAADVEALSTIKVVIADLPGQQLGLATQDTIYVDVNAAGRGWFVDPTPGQNKEFGPSDGSGELRALDPEAIDRVDLLTVLYHELGHSLGLNDLDSSADGLMSGVLQAGVRREPIAAPDME